METKFIEWSEIEFKGKKGNAIKTTCPLCSSTRKNPKDQCLYVNMNDGVAKCYNCDSLGFRDSLSNRQSDIAIKYDLPPQNWHNFTNLSDTIVQYFETRKISQKTLEDFGITQEKVYQPQRGKEIVSIAFNYFEGDILVNKKFRSLQKEFTQSKNGKPIFYNINSIIGADEVYIQEGELDVLSLYEIGIKNAISLPNGANDNDAFWVNSEKYLKDIKKFYIATDMDEKGEIVAEKIAQRLGRYRCERVLFEGKDANEDLQNMVLQRTIHRTKKYPAEGTLTMDDIYDELLDLYNDGIPKVNKPKGREFTEINEIFSTMKGQLTVVTGTPSSGKSSYTEWYLLNMAKDYNYKLSFFTPEHTPYSMFHSKMAEKVIGKPFFNRRRYDNGVERMNKEDLDLYKAWANERIYLTDSTKGEVVDWDWLLKTFEAQMLRYGINIFIVDAFNKVIMRDKDEKKGIRDMLTKLTQFCSKFNVEIFLIAHPTKMRKLENGQYEIPTLYDVSGSADFRNQTHNGYTIHREYGNNGNDRTLFVCGKVKFQFQGEIGKSCSLIYDIMNGRYYKEGDQPNRMSFFDPNYDRINNQPVEVEINDIEELSNYANPFAGMRGQAQSFDFSSFEENKPF